MVRDDDGIKGWSNGLSAGGHSIPAWADVAGWQGGRVAGWQAEIEPLVVGPPPPLSASLRDSSLRQTTRPNHSVDGS